MRRLVLAVAVVASVFPLASPRRAEALPVELTLARLEHPNWSRHIDIGLWPGADTGSDVLSVVLSQFVLPISLNDGYTERSYSVDLYETVELAATCDFGCTAVLREPPSSGVGIRPFQVFSRDPWQVRIGIANPFPPEAPVGSTAAIELRAYGVVVGSGSFVVVPEPASALLLVLGLAGLAELRRGAS